MAVLHACTKLIVHGCTTSIRAVLALCVSEAANDITRTSQNAAEHTLPLPETMKMFDYPVFEFPDSRVFKGRMSYTHVLWP